jgi:hypothetical protein
VDRTLLPRRSHFIVINPPTPRGPGWYKSAPAVTSRLGPQPTPPRSSAALPSALGCVCPLPPSSHALLPDSPLNSSPLPRPPLAVRPQHGRRVVRDLRPRFHRQGQPRSSRRPLPSVDSGGDGTPLYFFHMDRLISLTVARTRGAVPCEFWLRIRLIGLQNGRICYPAVASCFAEFY